MFPHSLLFCISAATFAETCATRFSYSDIKELHVIQDTFRTVLHITVFVTNSNFVRSFVQRRSKQKHVSINAFFEFKMFDTQAKEYPFNNGKKNRQTRF